MPNDTNNRQLLLYTAPDGDVRVEVLYQDETVWLTQKSLAELFGVDRTVIGRHLKNILGTGELDENVVSAKIAHTTPHGAIKGKTVERKYGTSTIGTGYFYRRKEPC